MDTANLFNLFAAALGWMVLHSVWQITLIYLLFRVVARMWRKHPRAIYHAALLGMVAGAVWAVLTFFIAWENYQWSREWYTAPGREILPAEPVPEAAPFHPAVVTVAAPTPWHRQLARAYESWAAPVGWFWSLCALLLVLRLWGGYWLCRRIRRIGVAPVSEQWQQQLHHWSAALQIQRPVRWLESTRVSQPLTLGFWKPVVLFPAGMLLQLQPGQVEALLLHELAHIRRYDYLVNLVQLVLEVCFFYHPLFWLLSKAAHRQREYCCDDLVLRHYPDRLLYAKTLTNLQYTHHTLNQFAMHAIGKSAFAQRIFRLFNLEPEKAQRSPGLMLFLVALFCATALSWMAFRPEPLPEPSELALVFPETKAAAPVILSQPSPVQPAAAEAVIAPDTSSPTVIAIETAKMNVFYIGVDNPITVAAPGYACSDLTVRLSGPGTLTALGDCRYIVQASAPGEIYVALFAQKNGFEVDLGVKSFRVKRIPADPAVRFEPQPQPQPQPVSAAPTPVADPTPVPSRSAFPPIEFEPVPAAVPQPTPIAVAATKMNVLYIGVNNPINVAVPGYKCDELELRLSGGSGSLHPAGSCQYYIRTTQPGVLNLEVYTRKNGKKVQLGVERFRVKWLPAPASFLADYSHNSSLPRAEIRNAMSRELEAVIENFDYDAHCSITQFTLAIWPEKEDVVELVVRGNRIPETMLERLEKLPAGSKIFIFNPYAKCPGDSAPRVLGDLAFEVVP